MPLKHNKISHGAGGIPWSVYLFGFLFDIAQLTLSVTDAFSDAAVAFEFKENGQMGFFYATISLLLLGSITDAIAFLVSIENNFRIHEWWKWPIFTAMLTPFAQVLPVVSFFLQKFEKTKSNDFAEYVDWDQRNYIYGASEKKNDQVPVNPTEDSGDAAREIHQRASDQDTLIQIDQFVASRQASFLVMNCQTLAESAPQCLVQLAAISLGGTPTRLQVLSLSLSLIGVASKTFQLCRSFTPSAFVAKLFFVVHDIFSISFLASSLFSSTVPTPYSFLGLEVCGLTWWWLFLKMVDFLFISFIVIAVCLTEISKEPGGLWGKLKLFGLFGTFYVLGVVPVAIIQETAKLSWYLPLNLTIAPSNFQIPRMPLLHDFLWSGGSGLLFTKSKLKKQWTDWKKTCLKFEQFVLNKVEQAQKIWMTRGLLDPKTGLPTSAGRQLASRNRWQRRSQRVEQAFELHRLLHFQLQPTFRQLAQPLEKEEDVLDQRNFDDVVSQDGSDQQVHQDTNKNKDPKPQLYMPDDFFSRTLHCLRISHCQMLLNTSSSYDPYYSANAKPSQFVKQCIDEAVDLSKEKSMLDVIDQNHRSLSLVDLLCIIFRKNRKLKSEELRIPVQPQQQQQQQAPGSSQNIKEIFAGIALTAIVLLTVLTSLFGLVYPILFAIHYFDTMQIMQVVCFYPTVICLVGSLVTLPAAYRYIMTCAVFHHMMSCNESVIGLAVDSYFSIPLTTIRAVAVPSSTSIPQECFDKHVLEFLDLKMVRLYGLGEKEFEKMEKEVEGGGEESKKDQ